MVLPGYARIEPNAVSVLKMSLLKGTVCMWGMRLSAVHAFEQF